MTDCLDGLVCLPPWDPCWGPEPANWPGGTCDGISITDVEYGFPLLDAVSDSTADMEAVLTDALMHAINAFGHDVEVMLGEKYARKRTWSGRVGRNYSSGAIQAPDEAGLRISPYGNQRDSYLVIDTIYVANGTGGPGQVFILDGESGIEETRDVTFGTTTPLRNELDEAIRIPLFSDATAPPAYYIYFPSTGTAPGITLSCCGGSPGWKKYFALTGVTGANLDTTLGKSPGISFEGCTVCDGLNWLCRCSTYRSTAAYAIAAAAGARLASVVLGSSEINRWTLLGADSVQARYDSLKGSYTNYLQTIVAGAPASELCCYACSGKGAHVRRSILV